MPQGLQEFFGRIGDAACEGDDASHNSILDRPRDGGYIFRPRNGAKMGLDFFKFHALPKNLHLIVNAAQVVKDATFILPNEIAGEVPVLAGNGGKALLRQFRFI
jgi:hypothetical protein